MAIVLLLGDLACFLLFTLIGLRSHDESYTAVNALRSSGFFALAWVAIAAVTGGYRPRGPRAAWKGMLIAWVPAWLVGLLARSLVFDRALKPGFALVALLFIGAALAAWRTLAWRQSGAGPARRASTPGPSESRPGA